MKQAVITGGNGTLGHAIAAALEDPGWKILTPSSTDMDVRDESSVRRFFQQNPLELLVCAAGIIRDAPLLRMTGDSWDDVIAVNFKGAVACARAALPAMIRNGGGHIIFISSFSALHPPVGQAAYATAKAALLGLMEDLARAHGPQNIRVNTVLPGFIETRMTESVSEKRREEVRDSHLLKRFNTPVEVGKFIRHLHHHLPHTSGQVFQLDSRIS
ncbi:MAG: SDR family NAD(P)-dependent oxidoreductase [Luteolibacter sp.]